jgi:hypothetical protein
MIYARGETSLIFVATYSKKPSPPSGAEIDAMVKERLREFLGL